MSQIRPVIARPLVAWHGGGGGHGGGGHGGHHTGIIGGAGPGYTDPGGGWKDVDRKAILACLGLIAIAILWVALAAAHDYFALVISWLVLFGGPLAAVALLVLVLLVARLLGVLR
jgi:hypothetical protein